MVVVLHIHFRLCISGIAVSIIEMYVYCRRARGIISTRIWSSAASVRPLSYSFPLNSSKQARREHLQLLLDANESFGVQPPLSSPNQKSNVTVILEALIEIKDYSMVNFHTYQQYYSPQLIYSYVCVNADWLDDSKVH